MLSLSVYMLGGSERTVATIEYAVDGIGKVTVELCDQSELKERIEKSDSELVHIVPDGAIVMPSFYKAMFNYIEHSHRDYVFCPGIRISNGKAEEVRQQGEFSCGQLIVRTWVVKELGASVQDLNKLGHRIISEYRGVEIPHNLYMEI